MAFLTVLGCSTEQTLTESSDGGALFKDGKFHNSEIEYKNSMGDILDITLSYVRAERKNPHPKASLPVQPISVSELNSTNEPVLYKLGHSSVLIRLDNEYFITDPVFSQRASPVQWVGPKRFHQPPVDIDDLPSIKAVVISHDHYDHLDQASVRKLAVKTEWFVVPLGVGKHLVGWGIDKAQIIEKDWWQSVQFGSVTLTATPAQHFSGRGLIDKNETLWASWVIKGRQGNLFFSGDSGYFSGFKEIGERYGPFDITMIETGAYNSLWADIHMLPEQGLQAHKDLKGKVMLPIHNSTFDLALHDWFEPLEEISRLAEIEKENVLTPVIGQVVPIGKSLTTAAWWRDYMNDSETEHVSLIVN